MKRMHIHVAVENLSESIRFYRAMFGNAEPTVLKSDYCKWELTNPAVNFAISQRGAKPGVDHIGIQVETDAELAEMNARFAAARTAGAGRRRGRPVAMRGRTRHGRWTRRASHGKRFRTLEAAPVYGHSREQSHNPQSSAACCAPAENPS